MAEGAVRLICDTSKVRLHNAAAAGERTSQVESGIARALTALSP